MSKLIPKYQTAWGKLEYKGPQFYEIEESLKREDPQAYNRLQIESAKSKTPNSEIVHYTDAEGNNKTTTSVKGMSAADPVGEFVVGNAVLNPVFKAAGTAALYGMGRMGNNWAKAKLISRAMQPSKTVVPINTNYSKLETSDIDEKTLGYILSMAGRKKIPYKKQYGIKELNPEIEKNLGEAEFDMVMGPDKVLGSVIGTYKDPRVTAYYDNIITPLLKSKNVKEVPPMKDVEVFQSVIKTPKWGGYHSRDTGRNFVLANSNDPRGTTLHEAGSHGTDHLVDMNDYIDLYYDINDYHPVTEMFKIPKHFQKDVLTGMRVPEHEQRATFNQARMQLYDKASKKFNRDLTLDEFNKYLDTLDDSEILKSMYLDEQGNWINGYAAGMGNTLKMNDWLTDRAKNLPKSLIQKYRNSYKTLPIIGVPILGAFKNQE